MAASKIENAPWVKLGDYIELFDNKNIEGIDYPYYGINRDKQFMPTVANTDGLDPAKYTKLEKGMFVFSGMQTGRDVCIRIGLYNEDFPVLISPAYITFKIIDENKIDPLYLFLNFNRSESDRRGWFLSDSSIRSNLDWDRFCEIKIPLPSIETQRELVAVYNGLKELAEENEKLLEPLSKSCQAFIVDCKNKYPSKRLGDYIVESDERNSNLEIRLSQGISNLKYFQEPKQVAQNSKSDKIVRKGYFAYNRATTRNGEKISIAYREGPDCTVSAAYGVFKIIKDEILNPHFLMLWFKRPDFDRYSRWRSEGSAHEFFTFEMMQNVKIPLPPIEIQQKIVDLYNCYEECKRIAHQAREKIKNLCPALVQKAAHSR